MGSDGIWGGDLGVEREREEVVDRFLKWLGEVGWCTPGYVVREEFQRDKLSGMAGIRAWEYERKLGEGMGGNWLDYVGRI